MISIFQVILGLSMLLLGRKLFWVYVGAIGFITATNWVTANMAGQPEWIVLLIGLAAGGVGILLAIFLRWVGIGIAGFLTGGFLASTLLTLLGVSGGRISGILYLVGGVVGVILFYSLFDWALVVLSSACGAFILARQLPAAHGVFWLVVLVMAVVGIGVQAQQIED
jgi:hypothetical protein